MVASQLFSSPSLRKFSAAAGPEGERSFFFSREVSRTCAYWLKLAVASPAHLAEFDAGPDGPGGCCVPRLYTPHAACVGR